MKTFSSLKIRSQGADTFDNFVIGLLIIYWVAVARSPIDAADRQLVGAWLMFIAIGLFMSGWQCGSALAEGVRVLGAHALPLTLWREWLRVALRGASVRWVLALVTGTALLMQTGGPWTWSAAAALYSLALLVGAVAALSHRGVWHWAWSCMIVGGVLLLAMSSRSDMALALTRASWFWYVPFALCWPAAAALLWHRWSGQVPQPVVSGDLVDPVRRCMGIIARYQHLGHSRSVGSTPVAWVNLMAVIAQMCFMISIARQGLVSWGQQIGLDHLFAVSILAVFSSLVVCCKDLHWRCLLAPNGFAPRRIGWHLLRSTLTLFAAVVSVGALLTMILLWLVGGIAPARYLAAALPYWVNALEVVLAVSVGVAVRGVRWAVAVMIGLGSVLVAGVLVYLRIFPNDAFSGWFVIGPGYVIFLLLATASVTALSNRLWTKEKLLSCLRSGTPESDVAAQGGRWFYWPGRSFKDIE